MLYYTGLILLVIGVSIDGFGVGMSYGMRRVRVPFTALGIIMFCSGLVVYLAMTIGNLLKSFITPDQADILGGVILLLIGLYCLFNVLRSRKIASFSFTKEETWQDFKTVMKEPKQADLDDSGSISLTESIFLGFALAVDAFGAGLGAAMIGYSPLVTAFFIAFMSGLFVWCGVRLGMYLSNQKWLQQLTLLPPLLLMLLGLLNIYY